MTIQIYNEPWQTRDALLDTKSFHLCMDDPPFNLAEVDRNALDIRPEWDVAWSPLNAIKSDALLLIDGGWGIRKTSDRLLGVIRDIVSGDHSNTLTYLKWMRKLNILDDSGYEYAIDSIGRKHCHFPDFEYKATVVWTKPSGTHLRENTYESRHELFAVYKKLDECGSSVPAPHWQFLSVQAMANHFSCPSCGSGERLYWHLIDRYEENGELRGTIVPCKNPKACSLCKNGDERRSHPTQTPRAVWDFFLERHAKKALRLRDRFMGVGSLARACQLRGIHYVGTEICWEYATVAQRWIDGEFWDAPEPEAEIIQVRFSEIV